MVLPGLWGVFVQGLLFTCCAGVFYIKRKKEEKELGAWARSMEEFVLDASKQFFGAGWIHVMNLGFATILNDLMSEGDECEWYWINIMVDTTLGTAVAYFLLRIFTSCIRKKLGPASADFQSGEYMSEDRTINFKKYGKQLLLWMVVLTVMKILMVLFMFLFSGPLAAVAGFILSPFLTQPWLKLLVVMIVCPLVMDGFQIWMVDNFIKKRTNHAVEGEEQDTEVGTNFVESSADTLLRFTQTCEAHTEETLISVRVKIEEALNSEYKQDNPEVSQKMPPSGEDFETQFNFMTRVPADQAGD